MSKRAPSGSSPLSAPSLALTSAAYSTSALSLGLVHRTEKGPMLKFSVSGGLNEGGQTPTIGMGAGWSW